MLEDYVPAPAILPAWMLHANLLHFFVAYVTIMFLVSIVLRLRFYASVYDIALHVRYQCPNLFRLIDEHKFLCIRDGILGRVAIYLAVVVPYMILNRYVWPYASINLLEMKEHGVPVVVWNLLLLGIMFAVDYVLLAQVSVIDADRVKCDLNYGEDWLGGNFNRLLTRLGWWNPIRIYANRMAQENLVWFNRVLRDSVASMIVQLVLRLLTAIALFTSVYWNL